MRLQGYLVVFGITMVLAAVDLAPRWVRMAEQRARVETLAEEVARTQAEIERLTRACEELESQPDSVERFVRERMDWRRPGEVVFH